MALKFMLTFIVLYPLIGVIAIEIGSLGGKARYLISFLQEATTVRPISIQELSSRNARLQERMWNCV